jgi:hypothetical protein
MKFYYVTDRTATHAGTYIDEDGRNVSLRINAQPFPARQAAEARARALDPENDWSEIEEYDDGRKRYAILRHRDFYGPRRTSDIVTRHAGTWEPLTFDTPRAARAWVAEQEAQPYHLAHNESARPSFHVTTVGSARFCTAYKAATGGLEWTVGE